MSFEYAVIIYLLLINLISVLITVKDKRSAINRSRRTSEKSLLMLTLLGGGISMYFTMVTIRHKTKHPKFMIGIPLIVIAQAMILITVYNLVKIYG